MPYGCSVSVTINVLVISSQYTTYEKLIYNLYPIQLNSLSARQKKSISLNSSIGNGALTTFKKVDGGGSLESKSLTNLGLNYSYPLQKKNWYLETSINYLVYKYTSQPSFPPGNQFLSNHTKSLISLPVKLNYEAGKYIFFTSNLYLGIDVSKDYGMGLSGIGAGILFGLTD